MAYCISIYVFTKGDLKHYQSSTVMSLSKNAYVDLLQIVCYIVQFEFLAFAVVHVKLQSQNASQLALCYVAHKISCKNINIR